MDRSPRKPMARNFSRKLRFKHLANRLNMRLVTRSAQPHSY